MLDHSQALDYLRRYRDVTPEILADGAWLLERRAFWLNLVSGYAEAELVSALFEGEDDDAWALGEQIRESGEWPVLRFGTGRADFAVVHWHGYDFEGGFDFLVLPDEADDAEGAEGAEGAGRCLSVAALEGHGYGPGLSWPEARRLVEWGRLGTPEQRLLLVLHALGDADTPEEAVAMVGSALLSVGNHDCDPTVAEQAARQLLECEVRWTWHDGALVCDNADATRTPGGLSLADLRLVTRALAA